VELGDLRVKQLVPKHVSINYCDRRQFPRLSIPVQAELRAQGNEIPIRVETADISQGGCYVQMAVTLPVQTTLKVTLWLGHEKCVVAGNVVSCHPQFGNGIEFVGLSQDSRQRLQRFLENAACEGEHSTASDGWRRK